MTSANDSQKSSDARFRMGKFLEDLQSLLDEVDRSRLGLPKSTGTIPKSSAPPSPQGGPSSKSLNELKSADGFVLAVVEHHATGEIRIAPKVQLPAVDSTYDRFLKPKILTPLAAKHPEFRYRPIINNGIVDGLELQASEELWAELIAPLTWTLEKARS